MTLHRLTIYQCVAKHLNLTKASRELRISQPSVSQQLKLLERDIELRLYRKIGRGIELTEEGRLFLKDAGVLLDQVVRLKENAKAGFYKRGGGTLKFAAGYGPCAALIPAALNEFRKSYPDVKPVIYTNTNIMLEDMLLESRLDLALTTQAISSAELVCEPFAQEELVLFASERHPIAKKRQVSAADLDQLPVVVLQRPGSKSSNTSRLLGQIKQWGAEMRVVTSCDVPAAVKAFVNCRMGLGILYRSSVSSELKARSLKIIDLPAATVTIGSYIMYHGKRPLSPHAQSFLDILRRSCWMNKITRPYSPRCARPEGLLEPVAAIGD